jgi:hypothetical protein
MSTTPVAIDLRLASLAELRAIDFRSPDRDFWSDEAMLWGRLVASWAGLDDAAWTVPGAAPSDAGGPDWSLLEHVAHLEDWQALDIGYVGTVLADGGWPSDDEYSGGDFDRFNEGRRGQYVGLAPAPLRTRLLESHDRLVDLAKRLPMDVIRSDAAWGWVFNVLHGHVLDHLAVLEPWADRLRARQADGDPFVADPRPASFDAFWSDVDAVAAELDSLLDMIPAAAWTGPEVTPRWSLLDHVGHLADWAAEGAEAVARFRRLGTWAADPLEGIDAWNEAHVKLARGGTTTEARARLAASMAALRAATATLSLPELRDPEGWSWAYDCLHGHVRKHLALIGPWAARQAWTTRPPSGSSSGAATAADG